MCFCELQTLNIINKDEAGKTHVEARVSDHPCPHERSLRVYICRLSKVPGVDAVRPALMPSVTAFRCSRAPKHCFGIFVLIRQLEGACLTHYVRVQKCRGRATKCDGLTQPARYEHEY